MRMTVKTKNSFGKCHCGQKVILHEDDESVSVVNMLHMAKMMKIYICRI
jgi:hypothetical protein